MKTDFEDADIAYRDIVESMVDGVVILDRDGLILYTNHDLPVRLGVSPEELTGRYFREFVPAGSEEALDLLLEKPGRREIALVSANGIQVPMLVSSSRFNGGTERTVLVLTDFSEQKGAPRAETADVQAHEGELAGELRRAYETLDFQARLLQNMRDAVLATDRDERVIAWNPAAERIYGWKAAEALGKRAADLLVNKPPGPGSNEINRSLSERGVFRGELLQGTRSGDEIWVESIVMPLYDRDGEIMGSFAVNRDITQRKRADAELARFKYLVQNAAEGIAVTDPALKIVYANESFSRLCGVGIEDLKGQDITTVLLSPEEKERLEYLVPPAIRDKGRWTGEIKVHRPDGSCTDVLMNAGVLKDDKDDVVGGVVMVMDISSVKEAEERLRAVNLELDSYAQTVSHDLRSPLTAVILANELMRDAALQGDIGEIKSEIEESTGTIGRNVSKAYALINDLLILAESGQRPARVADVDVNEVVDRVIEERQPQIAEKDIAVHKDDDLGRLRASETQIYQLLSNLIGNSIRHNDNPNPEVWIRRLSGDESHRLHYLVKDNSSGISAEQLETVFTPFYKRDTAGGGIGLTIVKKIVDVYHGDIRAYNDNGACFEFTLNDFQA